MKVSRITFFSFLTFTLAQFACNFGTKLPDVQPPAAATESPAAGNPAPGGDVNAGQIVVSGALNKTYSAVNVSIGGFGPRASAST